MIEQKVAVSFFLDRSRPSLEGTCLIKLNIYQKPYKKRYATLFRLTENEWDKLNATNLRDVELKKVKQKLAQLQEKAEKLIETIQPFSFVAFEEIFFAKSAKERSRNLNDWFKV